MVPTDAQVIAQCTVKVLVLSSSVDRPELWDYKQIEEQAANVKPCSLLLLHQSDTVRLHLEDKTQGKVHFHFSYDQIRYRVHSRTWHTLRLADDRCFGLVFQEDEAFLKFLQAFSLICSQVNEVCDVWENNNLSTEDEELEDSVRSHALPTSSYFRRKLTLDVPSPSNSASILSPSSPLTISSMQGSRSPRDTQPFPLTPHGIKGGVAELIQRLQNAIANGDTNLAKQISSNLSQMRANLSIDVAIDKPLTNRSPEIFVKLCVEDRVSSRDEIQLKVPTSMKIGELKKKMFMDHGFIPEVQRWIIGRRFVKDEQTLAQCGVNVSGATIYLYLISRKTIGLSDEDYVKKYGHIFPTEGARPKRTSSSASETSRSPVQIERPQLPLPRQVSQGDPVLTRQLQRQILNDTPHPLPPANFNPPPPPPGKVSREVKVPTHSKEGWACGECTYVNFWTRDTCEICMSSRPDDLQPPPDFIIPQRERERLEKVRRDEQELRTEQPVQPTLEITEQDLDLMLRLAVQQRENNGGQSRGGNSTVARNEEPTSYPLDEPESMFASHYSSGGGTLPEMRSGLVHREIGFESDLEMDESDRRSLQSDR